MTDQQRFSYQLPDHWDPWIKTISGDLLLRAATQPLMAQAAIRDATLRLETRVRDLCDAPLDLIGIELMSHAFHSETGFLCPRNLPKSEREGIASLYRGVVLAIRNPVGHRQVDVLDHTVFDQMAFVNYLLALAGSLARENLVDPFLPVGPPRAVAAVRQLRWLPGTFVVAVAEDGLSAGIRTLVLSGNPPGPLAGNLPLLTGHVGVSIADDFDLDGDGTNEILVVAAEPSPVPVARDEMPYVFHGLVFGVANGRATPLASAEPLVSFGRPLQICRPMEHPVPTVVGYDVAGQPVHWACDKGSLRRIGA